MANINPLTTERIILKRSAHQKPSTLNPGTILETRIMIIALITNVKRPIVTILIGSVKKSKIGFTKAFKTPSTIATRRAGMNPATVTPGRR